MLKKMSLQSRDALHLGFAERRRIDQIVTYDSDFENVANIKTIRPENAILRNY